jgi:hypothetical protein
MQTNLRFSLFERFSVVALFLIISVMAIHDVFHSLRVSEERAVNHAAVDYTKLKSMYAEQHQAVFPDHGPRK